MTCVVVNEPICIDPATLLPMATGVPVVKEPMGVPVVKEPTGVPVVKEPTATAGRAVVKEPTGTPMDPGRPAELKLVGDEGKTLKVAPELTRVEEEPGSGAGTFSRCSSSWGDRAMTVVPVGTAWKPAVGTVVVKAVGCPVTTRRLFWKAPNCWLE